MVWKTVFFVVLLMISLKGYTQSDVNTVLSKRATEFDKNDINILIKKGYIKRDEAPLIGTYMVAEAQKNNISKNETIREMLLAYKKYRTTIDQETALKKNFGKDSVFIRTPSGSRFLLGMGQMSLEKLVKRESQKLPVTYRSQDYQLRINTAENATKLGQMIAKEPQNWLFGNVMLIERDNGLIKELRIGDIFEISRRVIASKEFSPFVHSMD